ncbi:hypothetical protein C8J57DRAFT_1478707 [Mycena rebaudengoi]|nr:hypothetical protein C8J57DRAFT_1478707 [Mycena rebaudengoi]
MFHPQWPAINVFDWADRQISEMPEYYSALQLSSHYEKITPCKKHPKIFLVKRPALGSSYKIPTSGHPTLLTLTIRTLLAPPLPPAPRTWKLPNEGSFDGRAPTNPTHPAHSHLCTRAPATRNHQSTRNPSLSPPGHPGHSPAPATPENSDHPPRHLHHATNTTPATIRRPAATSHQHYPRRLLPRRTPRRPCRANAHALNIPPKPHHHYVRPASRQPAVPFPLTFWAARWLYLPTKLCTPPAYTPKHPASRNFALRAFAVPPIAHLSNVAVVSVARTRAAFVSRRGASYIVGDEYSTEWSGCGRLQGPQFLIRAFLSHLRNFLTNLPASAPQFVFISLDSGSYQSPHLTPALLDFIFVLYDLENAGSLTHASYRPPRRHPPWMRSPESIAKYDEVQIIFQGKPWEVGWDRCAAPKRAGSLASQRRTPLGVMVPCWLEGSDGCLVYPVVVYVARAVYATTTESELLPDTPDSKNPDQNIINPLKNPFTGAMEPSGVATAWIDPLYLEIGSTTAQYHSARFNIPLKCGWVDISSNGSILRCFVADWIMSWMVDLGSEAIGDIEEEYVLKHSKQKFYTPKRRKMVKDALQGMPSTAFLISSAFCLFENDRIVNSFHIRLGASRANVSQDAAIAAITALAENADNPLAVESPR